VTERASNPHARDGAFTSPDNLGTEEQVSRFLADVVRLVKPHFVVETGTYQAHTAVEIATALTENAALGFPGVLWTFEVDPEAHSVACQRLAPFDCVKAHLCTVQEVELPPVDIGFVDSAYEARIADVESIRRRLRRQGLLFVHDAAKKRMRSTVEGWEGRFHVVRFPTARGLALLQRRQP